MRVADIILQQLGGNKFLVMTGAKHLVSDGNTLRMDLPRNMSKANKLWITLDATDTYTMRFFKFRPARFDMKTLELVDEKCTEVKTIEGVYFDQLQPIFTRVTGMDTHL